MKIIVYALLAIVLIVLFVVIEILFRGLIRLACLIGLTFFMVAIFHQINR